MYSKNKVFLFIIWSSVLNIASSVIFNLNGILPGRRNRIEDVYLRFYNGNHLFQNKNVNRYTAAEHVDILLSQASRLFDINGFDKSNSTVLYVHGYIEVPEQESIQVIVNAYLQARPDTNVILLDWTNMAQGLYLLNAAPNSKKVGIAAAVQLNSLIDSGLPLDKVHIIGFSLGCHVAGYIAREMKNKYNKLIKRLTALDPAYPAFYPGVLLEHVNAMDAEFVDVIHTDAGHYGTPNPTGTADFWPNGGKRVQPGCPLLALIPLSPNNLCNHWRSWRFYAESVLHPEAFPASPAASYSQFRVNPAPATGMVYMGINCDNKAQGSYYLTTNSQTPFGRN